MTTVSDTDIKELKAFISTQFSSLEQKIENITKEVNELKVSIGKLDEKVIAIDKRLDDTNNNLNKRLDDTNSQIREIQTKFNGQTNWFVGIFSILVTGLLGILGKIAFFPNP